MRDDELTRLVALSPGDGRAAALIRRVCAQTLSLPPLPAEVAVTGPGSDADAVVADFAEQFSIDVSMIGDQQRSRLWSALGDKTFGVVVQMYIADFVPRVRAGLEALGVGQRYLGWADGRLAWDHTTDPSDAVFNGFLPAVARLRDLDALTSEMVRLRGAAQHNCRLCKSLRETTALDAGGSETLYGDIERFEASELLTDRQKAALRYADALIWSPGHIDRGIVAAVRAQFSDDEAAELTFDVMRNASNKVAVALAGDAPRVESGTEEYLLDANGQTVFS
ncbi:carboxymuconolactone decarboxylase family protein [Mycobacterium sp.]|uniref:carboxymuconolactone decarboxylase family protein n=1 Tax=Mycobacterium sp. TaxID=1785 RepID=UPI002D073B4E|nr:carboxymuconolactone decarboxylase family protein [Mycobacterium sp.]HXB84624.1 carboxymuconolactone decarboxylase family protein [Mycobacterium sp.]